MSALDPGESGTDEILRLLDVYCTGRRVGEVGGRIGRLPGYQVISVSVDDPGAPVPVDALICLGWSELSWAQRLRLLSNIRGHLFDSGLLLLDHAAPEMISSLRRAGFDVLRTEAVGVRLLAQLKPVPPRSLAVSTWATPADVELDLRYASDEEPLLDPRPSTIWAEFIAGLPGFGADLAGGYPVDDLFGGQRGAGVVGRFYGVALAPEQVTFGAGVTALLHGLSRLADRGPIVAPAIVHPDLEAWALSRGGEVHLVDHPATPQQLQTAIHTRQPAVLHLDRPDFTAGVLGLSELATLAMTTSSNGGIVVVDEAAAPYLGAADSAIQLVPDVPNIVVLRGFTKAYSWGGIRCAYAVASSAVAHRVRETVAPMQVGEPGFSAALRLLSAGDIFGKLRQRIRQRKPEFAETLTDAGFQVITGHPDVPWVTVADVAGKAARVLLDHGIAGLEPVAPPVVPAPKIELLHLTVPLSDERARLFRELIAR
ncbi:aminotransferase class I/II-fold pyridoxal phosphate-dependent enzyme [Nocardia sp. NPDC050175]|uniref:aminotransferase class I/II-fold pyridoxal phosphate-dependent enzyme n=1 Tax=Nocardia sp. NPDC050175 TaxID=3364317 RepID=UPI0037B30E56